MTAKPLDKIGNVALSVIVGTAVFLLWFFLSNLWEADANVKAGIIGFISAIAVVSFTHYYTKKREISARHFTDKRKGYMEFIDLFFEQIQLGKKNQNISQKKMIDKIALFKKSLMVWGGPEIIELWNSFELKSEEQLSGKEMMQVFEDILRAIRKDLGHDDVTLPYGNLTALILVAKDKKVALGE